MTDVFLYDAVRTPRGKARADGGLAAVAPQELVKQQIDALGQRARAVTSTAEALILGCIGQVGDQGGHIALVSKLHAGLSDTTAACSINNYCASGLSAIGQAAAMVGSGQADSVLAGGVECMSRVPFMGDKATFYTDTNFPPRTRYIPVVLAADRLAAAEGFTRDELDHVALVSQEKATAAEGNPALTLSRIPTGELTAEECIRPKTDKASLSSLPAAFGALQEQYSEALEGKKFEPLHTLGHAPPVCDGAALSFIGRAGLGHPRARILAFAESGGDPEAALTAGFGAMEKALIRSGLTLKDMDRIEFMESFAVTIARFLRDPRVDAAKVNVSGGHIAKGHPMGASGAILTSTLLDCLDAEDGQFGLVVVSGASGVGAAMVVERLK